MPKDFDSSERGKGANFREERQDRPSRRTGDADSIANIAGIGDAIECVIAAGCYLSFGRTTDGGATVVRVLDGDTKLTSYCTTTQQLLDAMAALVDRYATKPTQLPLSRTPVTFTAPDGRKKTIG